MDERKIAMLLSSRWCDALETATGKTMDELMQGHVDTLIQTLPQDVRDRITEELRQEDAQEARETERSRRFSVSRVTECGETHIYLSENGNTPFQTAQCLRRYLRDEDEGRGLCPDGTPLTGPEMERYVAEAVSGSPRVVGVYDIDLDGGEFSMLDAREGWKTFRVRDISTAIYFATKSQGLSWTSKQVKFYSSLDGKQIFTEPKPVFIRGEQNLPVDKLHFATEVSQLENILNFYVPTFLDPDSVLGIHTDTGENDSWLNLYADYDLMRGCVCDTLKVYPVRKDAPELICHYRLSPKEQAALLSKMDAYCKEQMGVSLEEVRAQYLSQQPLVQTDSVQTFSQPTAQM